MSGVLFSNKAMQICKGLLIAFAALVGLAVLAILSVLGWFKWQYHLPDEQKARELFYAHKANFVQMANLLRSDGHYEIVSSENWSDVNGFGTRMDQTRKGLFKSLDPKFILVRDDGAIEFVFWGMGGAIMTDSYLGIRYQPRGYKSSHSGWVPNLVRTLKDSELPHENGSVATGLYELEIEPEWFIYRLECQE